jgi:4-amino-4-deoxy-L-arabinose transferase-like glycosyltransferase
VTNNLQTLVGPISGEPRLRIWFAGARGRRVVSWTIVVLLGLLQAWSNHLLVDHDGVAYLDIAENYARGAWSSAINGFYSPLYSWLLASMFYVLKSPRSWDSTILHFVNFAGYLGAYGCFEFFLGQLIRTEQEELHSEDQATGLSESAWHTLGLALFLYTSLFMASRSGQSGQGEPGSTPDIFVLLFVYLAMGLLLRMQSGEARAGTYIGFGVTLAFGYFAKTAMFPLSLVFIVVAGFISLRQRKRALAFLLAPVCFVLIAGPWVGAISHAKGRYTFGDAGLLTYMWLAGPQANSVEWGGQIEGGDNMTHPPRRLSIDPPVYEFATPVPGTFPLWYGSSYWLEGRKFHFSSAGQSRIVHESYSNYWDILNYQKEYLVLLLVLILVQETVLDYFKSFLRRWVLWLPATAALGMYALVRVEPRYVAAYIAILWISLFTTVRLPRQDVVRQFVLCAVVATVLTTGAGILRTAIHDFHHSILLRAPNEQGEVAEGLRKLGVLQGQSLATIGIPRDSFYWARLAGVRVISEIPTAYVNQYWFASSDAQERVRSLFAQTGAVAIVTDAMPAEVTSPKSSISVSLPGWERIGHTSYFLFPLRTKTSIDGVPRTAKFSATNRLPATPTGNNMGGDVSNLSQPLP